METTNALAALAALSQETRLSTFRLLVQAGQEGLPAGDIATRLNARANTMSTHLSVLTRAGLIRPIRDGRIIRYAAEMSAMRDLIDFLMQDCCGGHPEICAPLFKDVQGCC